MKQHTIWLAQVVATASGLAMVGSVMADTTISTFDDFGLDGLFAGWSSANVVSGASSYSITSSNYGSGFKDISPNIDASGETSIELTVTLDADAAPSAPISGPIVSLVDTDGTFFNYAWYGQTKGTHVLTASLNAPSFTSAAGSIPGLNLSKLDFFHLQDDPGSFHGQYTITFENLRLIGAPGLTITAESYNPSTQEFTLSWTSSPEKSYTILYTASDLNSAFSPLLTGIGSGGTSTTATVTIPTGNTGFLRVQQE